MKKLFILLLSLALTLPLFAQAEREGVVFEWNDFSKGLNTKLSEYALPKSQATIAENVRFHKKLKSISKRNEVLLYGGTTTEDPVTSIHRLYLKSGNKVVLRTLGDKVSKGSDVTGVFTDILTLSIADYRWQWVTWHDIAIGTDGYNPPVKYDGSSSSATYLGSCLATDAGSGSGPDGTYTYKVTFYTASYEVSLDTLSNSITVSDNDINLSMIPIGPDTFGGEDTVGRKIYRTGDSDSTYVLLSNGDIANNYAVVLTDSDADGARSGALSPDYNYAPPKGKFISVHRNRLWIANNPNNPSRDYYSEDNSHDFFIDDSYFNVRPNDGDSITGIFNLLGVHTVLKDNTIQKIYTERADPDADWYVSDPFSSIGCKAPYSARITPLGIFYLGSDGIYKFDGQYSTLISDAITPEINDISESNYPNVWGEYHKSIYYMAYASKNSGSSTNNRVLLLDILSDAYSIDLLDVNCFTTFGSGSDWDILYHGSSTDGRVYAGITDVYNIIHRRHSDFTGTWDDTRYIPTRWGGYENSPVIEIARTEIIDSLSGTIDSLVGIIDREDTSGNYISQILQIGALTLDKLYWNEIFPATGGDVVFSVRGSSVSEDCLTASWSQSYTDPTGSDVSSLTGGVATATRNTLEYVQYRAVLTTDSINYTPTLYLNNQYVVKLTYRKEGSVIESSIPLHWAGGWTDLGFPGKIKNLKKLYCFHNSPTETGTLTLTFTSLEFNQMTKRYDEISETFEINLNENPKNYADYFTTGFLNGEFIKLDIREDSLNALDIDRVIISFDVEGIL